MTTDNEDRDARTERVVKRCFKLGIVLVVLGLVSWLVAIWTPVGGHQFGMTGVLLLVPGIITAVICMDIADVNNHWK
jgi:hypothetical protein